MLACSKVQCEVSGLPVCDCVTASIQLKRLSLAC